MMQVLSEWLREIIFIILLAVFIDLLLPSNRMQSYVKVVISLLIFMTILSPIIKLLKTDFNLDALIPQEQAAGEMASLASILQEAEALDQRRQDQAVEMVREQLALQIKQQIGVRFSVEATKVEVDVEPQEDGQIRIVGLDIMLAAPDEGRPRDGEDPRDLADRIAEVREVSIQLGKSLSGDTHQSDDPPPITEARRQPIAAYLEREWQIPATNIRISESNSHTG